MIRIGLYSEDRSLQPLLSSALGKEFQILLETDEVNIDRLVESGECDALILDLDSSQASLKERLEASHRIIESPITCVVMTDDGLRSTAVELVRLGAFGYCRKPPSIRDLKAMLRSAQENSALKSELRNAKEKLKEAST